MYKKILISALLSLLTVNAMAAEKAAMDFSAIEAQERAQIISELTYHLNTKKTCSQTINWTDNGSGADLDGYFFIPKLGKSEYMIGGHASHKQRSKSHCVITVSEATNNPKETPVLLVAPADWKQVWKDSGSGATKDGSFWTAIPPDGNYKCIGSISQLLHNQKPDLPNYRCVHKSLTNKIVTKTILWSDKGSGAKKQVTIFRLPATGAYIAVGSRKKEISAFDLKKNATSVPNPKKVEAILAKRLAPLKSGIEEKAKAIQEQKASTKEDVAKKAASEKEASNKAEQEKIAAAENKKQEVAKQEALAAQAEMKADISDEEVERLKEQQQARIAKAMAEKAVAEEAKQKEAMAKQAQEEKAQEEKNNEEQEEEIQPEKEIEEVAEIAEEAEPNDDIVSEPKKESKGLNSIMSFFLKVFGILVGGVIVLLIAFKVLFGKKSK